MAFTTGPDFLSGILGASNSTDVLNKFKSDTGQEDFYQGLRNRYGERIGDDGYLDGGVGTYDFIDSDRDGIDDRHQAGPGQPKAGSNPDGNPIFGGGNPSPGGSGGNNPNSPANSSRPVSYGVYDSPESYAAQFGNTDSYNPERSLYANFVPSNMGPSTTPFGMTYGETAPDLLETGYNISQMVPSSYGILSSLASTAYDKFIDPVDQAIANAFGFTPEEGEYDNSAAAAALSLLGPTSYEANQAAAIENSLANLAYKEQINSLAEVDPALRERLTSFGEDLSIDNYNTALSEVTPTDFSNLSLTTNNPLGAYQAANRTNSLGNTEAEQNAINNAVYSGGFVGYGQNEDGDFAGLVTNPQYDNEGNMVSNNPVTTGYDPNNTAIQNENYHSFFGGTNTGGGNNTGGTNTGGVTGGVTGAGTDGTGGPDSNPGYGGNNTGGSGGFSGGANPMGGGFTGGR